MVGLAMLVQQTLSEDPLCGAIYAFRRRGAGLIKLIWHDGLGLQCRPKWLKRGQFAWPSAITTGRITSSPAQLPALLDGCEWARAGTAPAVGTRRIIALSGATNSGSDAMTSFIIATCRAIPTGSVSLRAIGWMGHAACSLWGLEWNAVLGMWIGGYQRAA